MRQEPILITPAFYRYTTSIFILLICLIIPITSLFALDVSISGPDEVLVNESADFSVSVDCDAEITSVNWTFGDGSSSSGSTSASHRYKKVGDFTVTVSVTVSKTITNEEGEEKTYTDSGSDTHKITIKGKLKLKAEPDIIPVDTGSTTISAKVVDYRGSTVSSYNKTVNLTSSNTKTLKVKDISVSSGTGSSTAKAGKEPDIVIVTGSGSYLRGDSCEVVVFKIYIRIKKKPGFSRKDFNPESGDYYIELNEAKIYAEVTPQGAVDLSKYHIQQNAHSIFILRNGERHSYTKIPDVYVPADTGFRDSPEINNNVYNDTGIVKGTIELEVFMVELKDEVENKMWGFKWWWDAESKTVKAKEF
ncbi:MAG TPA: PKD domain-containing protein [Candidatus Omnitrophica bacterium]|nr:PKD domain-containing protein [Candidatus Omnitrophota bacterium]